MSTTHFTDPRRGRSFRNRRTAAGLIAAAIVVAGTLFWWPAFELAGSSEGESQPGAPPPTTVRVAAVHQAEVIPRQSLPGTLRSPSQTHVAAREAGAVAEVRINEGSTVEAGDVLVRLDDRRLRSQLEEAKARRSSAEATLLQREAERERSKADFTMKRELFEQNAISRRELLDAERERNVAVARALAAERNIEEIGHQLELLQVRLDDLVIVAPFSGHISERQIEPGEWVSAGMPVATLHSTEQLEAWVQVPERFYDAVQANPGETRIRVRATGDEAVLRTVQAVRAVDERSRTFALVATIDNAHARFSPGMSISAEVPMSPPATRLVVPVDAVIRDGENSYLYAARQDAETVRAERVAVTIIEHLPGVLAVEAHGSLSTEDQVVIEGNERLQPANTLELVVEEPELLPSETPAVARLRSNVP